MDGSTSERPPQTGRRRTTFRPRCEKERPRASEKSGSTNRTRSTRRLLLFLRLDFSSSTPPINQSQRPTSDRRDATRPADRRLTDKGTCDASLLACLLLVALLSLGARVRRLRVRVRIESRVVRRVFGDKRGSTKRSDARKSESHQSRVSRIKSIRSKFCARRGRRLRSLRASSRQREEGKLRDRLRESSGVEGKKSRALQAQEENLRVVFAYSR